MALTLLFQLYRAVGPVRLYLLFILSTLADLTLSLGDPR